MADRAASQPVSVPEPQMPDGQLRTLRERYPTMVHFIMASVVLTPLALAPYLPIRSRLVRVGRDIRAGNQSIAALRQELATASREQDIIGLRQEVESLRAELEGSRKHLANATADLVETQRHLHAMVVSTTQLEATVKSSSAQLDGVRSRELSPDVLNGIGDSFGAMASVLEEIELTFGLPPPAGSAGWDRDPRGIAAMRQTALRLKAAAAEAAGNEGAGSKGSE